MNKKLIFIAAILFISSISYTGFSSGESKVQGEGDVQEVQIDNDLPKDYDHSGGFITYGLTKEEIKTIKTCLDKMEEQVNKLRAIGNGPEADELADHLSALRKTNFTKGTTSISKPVYGYVYSGIDPKQWMYLTDDFFKLNNSQLNGAKDLNSHVDDWQQLTTLEQVSVLIHERTHSSIQTKDYSQFVLFDWNHGEKDTYTIQYKWLKLFMAKNDYWKNVKEAQIEKTDTTLVDDVKSNLKKYGVLEDITKTTELDKSLLGSREKFDSSAYQKRYESLEKKWDKELPQFPTGRSTESDIKKIEEWRDECIKLLDPKKDAARLANQDDCWAEVNRIHANNDMLYCRTCKQITKQYWIQSDSDLGPHWMCQCSTVTQIADLTRPDGKTYRQYAKERIEAVNKIRQEKEQIASNVIQEIKRYLGK